MEFEQFSAENIRELTVPCKVESSWFCTAEKTEGCGSDSADGSGKAFEALSAVVQCRGRCSGEDRVVEKTRE